ncbi:putative YUP8H12R.23 protein [Cinnamomum micranthum f. kanehirae]|uniref:Putative YUP8H12R.23 protein n=1 Tax=Cinnamomum micranthum f. kanehirae TaxID=337451 RepID=A0A443NTR3_9MAGN|nr:putative YUP8H12R.23 protein [Cinnamomum micranthum f. kanehirae]
MAAEVGSLFHFLSGYKEDQQKIKPEDPNIPITRDLLGGSKELDLDLDFQVPNGWEKRLDLKSGKVYMQQRCNSLNSSSSSDPKPKQQQQQQISVSQLQDLNFPPNLVEEGFDLQKKEVLVFPSVDYQSVCTLDKVKSALERVERGYVKKRSLSRDSSSSMTISSSLSSPSPLSTKGQGIEDGDGVKSSESTESSRFFAAACPNCLFYVLTSKKNPKCPKCDVVVPFRLLKKPKIDLNS